MPILNSQIVIGGVYATPKNQHRVILGRDSNGKIVYSHKGGNTNLGFQKPCYRSAEARFCKACSKILKPMNQADLKALIKSLNVTI